MNEIWRKPAEEVGLKLHLEPLLGNTYLMSLHGMVSNDQEFPCSVIVRWQDHQIWRMELQEKLSTHVHYTIRVDGKPKISEFTVELREAPKLPEREEVERYPWKFVIPHDSSAPLVSELPENPYPGQRVNFLVDSKNKVEWTFEFQADEEAHDDVE